jgi:hypothetical protein
MTVIKERSNESNLSSTSLIAALCFSRNFKSTNPQDKTYAVYGVLQEPEILLDPDYSIPYKEVFRQVSIINIVHHKRMDYLSSASHNDAPETHGLPAWVTDWSLSADRIPYIAYKIGLGAGAAAGETAAQVFLQKEMY